MPSRLVAAIKSFNNCLSFGLFLLNGITSQPDIAFIAILKGIFLSGLRNSEIVSVLVQMENDF